MGALLRWPGPVRSLLRRRRLLHPSRGSKPQGSLIAGAPLSYRRYNTSVFVCRRYTSSSSPPPTKNQPLSSTSSSQYLESSCSCSRSSPLSTLYAMSTFSPSPSPSPLASAPRPAPFTQVLSCQSNHVRHTNRDSRSGQSIEIEVVRDGGMRVAEREIDIDKSE